jgi:hypothetical protein
MGPIELWSVDDNQQISTAENHSHSQGFLRLRMKLIDAPLFQKVSNDKVNPNK